MPGTYQVLLKDQTGVTQVVLSSWRSLDFMHDKNGLGFWSISLDGELDIIDDVQVDWEVEIWRQDLPNSIALYLEYEGLMRYPQRTVDEEGRSIAVLSGVGYNDLLRRRGIYYPSGSSQAEKSDVGETVMKEYVDENAGPSATSPPRLEASGVTPGLSIQADGGAGASWSGARAYRNLLAVCQEIGESTGVDFKVVGTGPYTWEFQAQATPLGDDRSTAGLDPSTGLNGAGNTPVVFSLPLGNMQAPSYSIDRRAEVNAVLVLGQGLEDDREVVERSTSAVSDSPINRCEAVRPASLESVTAGLETAGDALLEELQARESFIFQPIQIPGLLYGRDYFPFDLVTASFAGIERDKELLRVRVNVSEGRENISIEVADI